MAEKESFFASVKDAEDISNWCKEFGIVNKQPEIVRAGELIGILLEKEEDSARQIAAYSDELERSNRAHMRVDAAASSTIKAATDADAAKAAFAKFSKEIAEAGKPKWMVCDPENDVDKLIEHNRTFLEHGNEV